MTIAYEHLELLPQVMALLLKIEGELELIKPNFTDQKSVLQFLGIHSRQTLHTYIESGVFKEGIHYHRQKNKVVWIKDGIIEFKKSYIKNLKPKSELALAHANIINKYAA